MQPGKVYLVGAGPGHPELLTLKAAELLKAADVIVYDRLIQEEVLALAKVCAERIYMGKPVGKHGSRQDEIHELLARKAREGKMVVRLKGGDPFLFGRGGEEAEFLAEHGIPFEIIPGVSSALAAPLGAGIAVTHRDAASSVAIVTGHEATKNTSRVDWAALSKLDTLVFLMGVNNLGRIAQELIAHGLKPATPAAMIQTAFWPEEKVVTGTLSSIAADVERAGIGPPATLVVGEVVRLREKLRNSQRDLLTSHAGLRTGSAPMPDQLLRMATQGLGAQTLGFALSLGLFDYLEQWQPADLIARRFNLHVGATAEILDSLVALGLLERGAEGYQNLELASVYLRTDAPQTLTPFLLHQLATFSPWDAVAAYARNGQAGLGLPAEGTSDFDCCECLAAFSAPLVAKRIDLAGKSPVLLLGWGGDAYRRALAQRWPDLVLEVRNSLADSRPMRDPQSDTFGAVLLSGMIARSEQEEKRILEVSAAALKNGGVLALHDAFLPNGALPPEVVLGALGRHLTCRPAGNWSVDHLRTELESLGLRDVRPEYLPGGTVIVTARKRSHGSTGL